MPPVISVVIGTLNHPDRREQSLQSRLQTSPSGTFEIVVDDRSTARTLSLVNGPIAGTPHMRLRHEPKRGLSNERAGYAM